MRLLAAAVLCAAFAQSAAAQSNVHDLSKPMTGKSRYVFNHDGTPAELGVKGPPAPGGVVALPQNAASGAWAGAAPVQESGGASVPAGQTAGRSATSRSAGTVVLISGRGAAAVPEKAQPRRALPVRIGRRGRR